MLLSLGLAALAAIAVLVTTRAVIVLQDREAADNAEAFSKYKLEAEERTAALDRDAKVAQASASEANARALEAKLALEQFKADRTLTKEQQDRISEKIKEFAGQTYILSVTPDQESIRLLRILAPIFISAGWVKVKSPSAILMPEIDAGVSAAPESGVRIQIAEDSMSDLHLREVAQKLSDAIDAEGVAAEPRAIKDELDASPQAVQIRVGSKPR